MTPQLLRFGINPLDEKDDDSLLASAIEETRRFYEQQNEAEVQRRLGMSLEQDPPPPDVIDFDSAIEDTRQLYAKREVEKQVVSAPVRESVAEDVEYGSGPETEFGVMMSTILGGAKMAATEFAKEMKLFDPRWEPSTADSDQKIQDVLQDGVSSLEFGQEAIFDANVRLLTGFGELAGFVPEGTAEGMRQDYETIREAYREIRDEDGNVVREKTSKRATRLALIAASNLIPTMPSVQVGALLYRIAPRLGLGVVTKRITAASLGAATGAAIGAGEAQGFPEEDRKLIVLGGTTIGAALGVGGQFAGEVSALARSRNRDKILFTGGEISEGVSGQRTAVEFALDMRETVARLFFTDRRFAETLKRKARKSNEPRAIELADELVELTSVLDRSGKMAASGLFAKPRLYRGGQWGDATVPILDELGNEVGSRSVVKSLDEMFGKTDPIRKAELENYPKIVEHLGYFMAYRRHMAKVAAQEGAEEGSVAAGRKLDPQTTRNAIRFLEELPELYPPKTPGGNSIIDEIAAELRDVSHLQLMNLENSGIITGGQRRAMMSEGLDYVPFHRLADELEKTAMVGSTGKVPASHPLRSLTAGLSAENQILSPVAELFQQTAQITQMVNRQAARSAMIDLFEETPDLFPSTFRLREGAQGGLGHLDSRVAKTLDKENRGVVRGLNKELEALEIRRKGATGKDLDEIVLSMKQKREQLSEVTESSMRFFEQLQQDDKGALKVFRPGRDELGEEITIQRIYDAPEGFLDAVDALPPEMSRMVGRISAAAVNMLRLGALSTPQFAFKNFTRDQLLAGVTSQNGLIPFMSSIVTGMQSMAARAGIGTDAWNRLVADFDAEGVMQATFINATQTGPISRAQILRAMEKQSTNRAGRALRSIDRLKDTSRRAEEIRGLFSDVRHTYFNPLKALEEAANQSERITRLTEFRLSRRGSIIPGVNRAPKSVRVAGRESSDVTLNFARGGRIGRSWNRWEPFINAELQDWSKASRLLLNRETSLPTITKAMAYIVLPALATQAMWKDDEDYQQQREHQKSHFLFFGKNEDGTFLKMPRVQGVMGVIFGLLPEALMAKVYEDPEMAEGAARLSDMLTLPTDPEVGTVPPSRFAGGITAESDPRAAEQAMDRFKSQVIDSTSIGIPLSFASIAAGGKMDQLGIPNDKGERFMESVVLGQLIQPAAEAYFNRELFRDVDIIPRRLLELFPEQHEGPGVTSLATDLALVAGRGNKFAGSPIAMQHLIDGYFGTLGHEASVLLSGETQPERGDPATAATPISSLPFPGQGTLGIAPGESDSVPGAGRVGPLLGSFRRAVQTPAIRDKEGKDIFGTNSQFVSDLYELRDSARKAKGAFEDAGKRGNVDEQNRIISYNPEFVFLKELEKATKEISSLASDRRVWLDSDLPEDEKFDTIMIYNQDISTKAADTVESYLKLMLRTKAKHEGTEFSGTAPFVSVPGGVQ